MSNCAAYLFFRSNEALYAALVLFISCSNNLCWIPFMPYNTLIAQPISPSKLPRLATNIKLVQHLHLLFAQSEC